MDNESNNTNNYNQNNQGNYNANPHQNFGANSNSNLDTEIAEQQKHFKWYKKLPLILAIVIIVYTAIIGVSSAIELESATPFITYLVAGVIIAAIEYFIGRILYSQMILTVLYLQKLNDNK